MHVSTLALGLLAASVHAVPVANDDSVAATSPRDVLQEASYPITQVHAREDAGPALDLDKRDQCQLVEKWFDSDDGRALQKSLQTNNPDEMTYLPHGYIHEWWLGGARVCVYNHYWFENTHVKRWEVGWAVGYILDKCCNQANIQCHGGANTAHGDSGLNLDVRLKTTAYGC
ncbi:hypothetical protein TARUN_10259 [Trichoderma arundinaceum]|uniref:Uncharacterized protein n=1 Tax=Trichoderma arundinaceum TaxID=490622 RepID=A0A395N7A9_TRIAR|nr:hypothetical protein TARUN_10259 [Trichoderma arundinaceum]